MSGEIHRARRLKQRFQQLLTELAEQDQALAQLETEHGTAATAEAADLQPLAELFDANNGEVGTRLERAPRPRPNATHVFVRC